MTGDRDAHDQTNRGAAHQRKAQSCPGPVHCGQFVSQRRGHRAGQVAWGEDGAIAVGALVAGRCCVLGESGGVFVEAGPVEEIFGARQTGGAVRATPKRLEFRNAPSQASRAAVPAAPETASSQLLYRVKAPAAQLTRCHLPFPVSRVIAGSVNPERVPRGTHGGLCAPAAPHSSTSHSKKAKGHVTSH